MNVLAVTIFVSLALAGLFVVAFLAEAGRRSRRGSIEQDALLPFDDPPPARRPPAQEPGEAGARTGPSTNP